MFQKNIENSYIEKLGLLSGKTLEKISRKELIDSISGNVKTNNSLWNSIFSKNKDQTHKVTQIEKFINETNATSFKEKIVKDEICDSDFIIPELHLVFKLCLNETFLNIVDKIDDQEFLSYIAEVLIEIYNETKSNEILLKLNYTLKKCREESCDNLVQYLSNNSDPEILRILYLFFRKENKTKLDLLEKCVKNTVFAKFSKDQIQNTSYKNVNPVVFSKCTSLIDKIILFHNSFDDKDLSNLLAISYVVDRPFYNHLESLILESDKFFPQKYSFNPYEGKVETLQKAISNLLNIIVVDEVKKENGIEYMQKMIKKYESYTTSKPNFSHPIFYLVNARMWNEIQKWIEKEPQVLLAKDTNGMNLLISTLLTFAHGHVKDEEQNTLLAVQEFAIKQYINLFQNNQAFVKPSVALFTSFCEYAKLANKDKNNVFIQKTFLYYKNLLENFIIEDSKSGKNSFLDATVFSATEAIPIYRFILQSGYKISYGDKIEVSDKGISFTEAQLSKIFKTQQELLNEIYSHLFDKKKVNQNAELILENLLEEAKRCVVIDNSFVSKIIKEFITLKYSEEFTDKSQIQKKFYSTILEIIKLPHFDFKEFCTQESETFAMICDMGEYEFVKALQKYQIDSPKLLNEVVNNGIKAFWYANPEQSDPVAAHNFSEIAIILKEILRKNHDVVKIYKTTNSIGVNTSHYFSTLFSGSLSDNKEQFSLDTIQQSKDPIDTYNKAILTIASQFLWSDQSVNYLDPLSYIKLSLLTLGHPNHHSPSVDEREKILYKAFESVFKSINKYPDFLKNFDDLTSNLWNNIRNLGYARGKRLIDFFYAKKFLDEAKEPVISRFIRQSIIMNDIDSAISWIKENKSFIPYALEVSVSVLNSKALSKIIDEFGLQKTEKNLFGILYEHSKSQMIDNPEFKKSLDEIAVILLTNGYKIELIEEALRQSNYIDFIRDLSVIQMKYAAGVGGVNYIRNALPLNNVGQFFLNTSTKFLTAKFTRDFYDRSFDFIYNKLSQNPKIDISGFCHIFPSILQPKDFVSRLKNISFLTGLRENFDKKKDMSEIIRSAQDVMRLISSEIFVSLQEKFRIKSIEMGFENHNSFEDLKKHLGSFPIDKTEKTYLKQKDFLLHRFETSYKELPPITSDTKLDFKSLVASTSASAISGTFLYVNDPDFRNIVQGIVAVLPTISSGISVANSITTNTLSFAGSCFNDTSKIVADLFKGIVKDNHEIAYTALNLAIGGGVIYLGHALYQKYKESEKNELKENISINIETIKELAKKFYVQERNIPQKLSDDEIYEFLKQLKEDEFIEKEQFFRSCRRFGVTTKDLSEAIEKLSADGMFYIAYAMSINAMYKNAIKVKNAFDMIKSNDKLEHKNKIVEILLSIGYGEIPNIRLALKDQGILQDELYKEIVELKISCKKPLIEHYKPEKHDVYGYALKHINKNSLTVEQLNTINNDPFMAFILKLSDALKVYRNCQEVESEVVVKQQYLSLM